MEVEVPHRVGPKRQTAKAGIGFEALDNGFAAVDELLPHELAEETQLYPALARPLGSSEATATMSRTHADIERLAARIGTHLDLAHDLGRIGPDQRVDLLACLYGLHALLRLHFLQEEENYFTLIDDPTESGTRPSPR